MIKRLYSTLNEFKNPEYLIEQKIYRKIRDFNDNKFKNKKIPIDSEFFYEETAFAFMETECDLQGWEGLHYAPFCSGKYESGKFFLIQILKVSLLEWLITGKNDLLR